MKIGEAAKIAEVNIETIRYYERKGLIQRPEKRSNGYRDYSETIINTVKFIKNAQKLGFSLHEIEGLLDLQVHPEMDCCAVKEQAVHKIEEIDRKIEALEQMKKSLTEISNRCDGTGPISSCNILNALNKEVIL